MYCQLARLGQLSAVIRPPLLSISVSGIRHLNIDSLERVQPREPRNMYRQLAELPAPTGAQFLTHHDHPGPTVVQLAYSVRDHDRNTKRPMSKSKIFSPPKPSLTEEDFRSTLAETQLVADNTEIVLQAISPSKKKKAILRKIKGDGSNSSRCIEIWANSTLEAMLDVTGLHGEFYNDEFLSALTFSPSESGIIYVAETKAPSDDANDKFAKYRYVPDFGEGLTGKRTPALYLFRWYTSGSTKQKPTLYRVTALGFENVRFGQVIFDPQTSDSSSLVIYATGYEAMQNGRMLGIKGCPNRPTGIWRLCITSPASEGDEQKAGDEPSQSGEPTNPTDLQATSVQKLTPPHLSCRSPRIITISENSTLLVWLSCATGGAHAATNSLHALNVTSKGQQLEEGKLSDELILSGDTPLLGFTKEKLQDISQFPGLYPAQNLASPSSIKLTTRGGEVSPFIITHSAWGSRTTIILISLRDGSIRDLTPLSSYEVPYSWSVLATNSQDTIIAVRSTPSIPYEILLGKVRAPDSQDNSLSVHDVVVDWYMLDQPVLPDDVATALSTISTKILPIEGKQLVETVLIQPPGEGTPPCITSPHGGPHGTSTTAFTATITALVLEGYTFSFPNYTGSLGYGEHFVQGLIGRCGELDVEEVVASVNHLVKAGIAAEGEGRHFIYGGSHGGFLGAHLIAKYPLLFSGAILRNPVISAGELSTTDLPDWYFAEFGHDYPLYSSPRPVDSNPAAPAPVQQVTPELYSKLYTCSPIAHVDKVQAPVLLMIGKEDRRVAPSHGMALYHALKARANNPIQPHRGVEMLIFDGDSHPLDSVEASRIGFEASRDWLASLTKNEG